MHHVVVLRCYHHGFRLHPFLRLHSILLMALTCSLINDHVSLSCDRENCSVLINRRQTMTHEWNKFLWKSFIKTFISSIQFSILSYPDKARSNSSYHFQENHCMWVVGQYWVHCFSWNCRIFYWLCYPTHQKWLRYYINGLSGRNPDVVFCFKGWAWSKPFITGCSD